MVVELTVNGETLCVANHPSLLDLVQRLHVSARAVVVSVNQQLVRKEQWEQTQLKDGDSIEVFTAFEGG